MIRECILFYSHGPIRIDFFIRVLATLDALHHLCNGHVEAQERAILDQIVLFLNMHRQGSWQALPLDVMLSRVVQQFNLNVLSLVQCVLEHEMCIVDLRRIALKKCEVLDASVSLFIHGRSVDDTLLGFDGWFFSAQDRLLLRHHYGVVFAFFCCLRMISDNYLPIFRFLRDLRLCPSCFPLIWAAAAEELVSHIVKSVLLD